MASLHTFIPYMDWENYLKDLQGNHKICSKQELYMNAWHVLSY